MIALSIALAALFARKATASYFIDWSVHQCVESCDDRSPCIGRKHSPWEELFPSLEDCCLNGLHWKADECLFDGSSSGSRDADGDRDNIPADKPLRFFVDWDIYQCKADCKGKGRGKGKGKGKGKGPCANRKKHHWEHAYKSKEDCCKLALSWVEFDECITNGPSSSSTPSPSTKEDIRLPPFVSQDSASPSHEHIPPSASPSPIPSATPTSVIRTRPPNDASKFGQNTFSAEPTVAKSASSIGIGTDSKEPSASPATSNNPTADASIESTQIPSANPTIANTVSHSNIIHTQEQSASPSRMSSATPNPSATQMKTLLNGTNFSIPEEFPINTSMLLLNTNSSTTTFASHLRIVSSDSPTISPTSAVDKRIDNGNGSGSITVETSTSFLEANSAFGVNQWIGAVCATALTAVFNL